MISRVGLLAGVLVTVSASEAFARGVTPYLPLNLDPEVERQVERVLILGDKPVLTRPIPAALVMEALPKACKADPVLCESVRRYLKRYMHGADLEFASAEADYTHGSNPVMPNQHGRSEQNHYQVAGAAYWQPGDYALVNVGGVAYEGRVTPTGSVISLGFDWAQLDLGWRDHWWSPMTDSSMLLSTEAPTMPSITLSNYEPIKRLGGLHYEIFLARMSYSKQIELPVTGQLTAGYPKVGGLRIAFEPTPGWSISANRILIFGGGAAGGQSIGNIFQAFFNPSKAQENGFGTGTKVVGKQEASVTSRFIFPGPVPFAVYFEYSGNDTDASKNYLFGKPDLSMGLHFPRVGPFDVTLENSYWAPTWYVHGYSNVQTGYGDGITNDGDSFGHWFGDQRVFGDAIGGRSYMFRVGWEPSLGGLLELQLRALANDNYGGPGAGFGLGVPYHHEYMGSLTYSYPWRDYVVGGEFDAGRDVFGHSYTRLAAFVRFGDALRRAADGAADDALGLKRPNGAELFVDAGANATRDNIDINGVIRYTNNTAGPHLGFGGRREVSLHQDLGFRIEADEIAHRAFYNFRLLDYRWRFINNPLALEAFGGAARFNLTTPAYSFTLGGGVQWRNLFPGWDLGLDFLYGPSVARLRLLQNDVQGGTHPDSFHNMSRLTLYLSRKF